MDALTERALKGPTEFTAVELETLLQALGAYDHAPPNQPLPNAPESHRKSMQPDATSFAHRISDKHSRSHRIKLHHTILQSIT
jgi:hypothetical protein